MELWLDNDMTTNTTTATPIQVGDIQVGDIIEQRHETATYKLSTGTSRQYTDVSQYIVIKIGEFYSCRTVDGDLRRYRTVTVQSVGNVGKKYPRFDEMSWSDDYDTIHYFLVNRPVKGK